MCFRAFQQLSQKQQKFVSKMEDFFFFFRILKWELVGSLELEKESGSAELKIGLKKVAHPHTTFQCECPPPPASNFSLLPFSKLIHAVQPLGGVHINTLVGGLENLVGGKKSFDAPKRGQKSFKLPKRGG